MRRCEVIILLIAAVMAVSGCAGGSNSTPSPQLSTSVTVTPANATVLRGATQRFTATVAGTGDTAVVWSVQEKQQGIDAGMIDNTGLYTAPLDAEGTFHVVATSHADPTATGTAAVSVPVPAVAISPTAATLAPGGTQTFSSSVAGLADTEVTWTVQEASGGIVTATGFYTAPLALGVYHVFATSVADATVSASATITVTTSFARFTPTGNMRRARGFHTATLLANGKVLMAGGAARADLICIGGMASAELYDPAVGSFASTGNMAAHRYAQTATPLLNGEVLVVGGFGSGVDCEDLGEPAQMSAELFNPSAGSFKATGNMFTGRGGHTATLLPNGNVLVVGGGDQGGGTLPFYGTGSATAEVYDTTANTFASTGNMAAPRFGHTATLLTNGKVLIVGGFASHSSDPTAAAEVYDPATGHFTLTANMAISRGGHAATELPDGRVLITGGLSAGIINGQFDVSSTAEIYDPNTGSFSATGQMGVARQGHTAMLLSNGMVLVAGGGSPIAELYDPSTGSFSLTGSMETQRTGHSATVLLDGRVLVAGGGSFSPLTSAELYK